MQKVERKAQINARCQIRVNFIKKDGRRVQISSVGRKLLYEIHSSLLWISKCPWFRRERLEKQLITFLGRKSNFIGLFELCTLDTLQNKYCASILLQSLNYGHLKS
jgi:hypothetical protein